MVDDVVGKSKTEAVCEEVEAAFVRYQLALRARRDSVAQQRQIQADTRLDSQSHQRQARLRAAG